MEIKIKNIFENVKKNMNKQHILLGIAIAIALIGLDQVTKMLALIHLEKTDIVIIENFFSFSLHFNTGAAFSSFAGEFGTLMIITAIAIVVFTWFFLSVDFKKKLFYSLGITLMFGGLFGNMIDRVAMQKVVDFLAFDFGSYSFPIFNVADICLVVGTVLFMVDVLFFEGKRNKKEEISEVQGE